MSSIALAPPSAVVYPHSFERVLVMRTGHLGDTICAIPAFRLLRQFFHGAHLTLLCDRPARRKVAARDVIDRLNLFDEIVTYESSRGLVTLWELFRTVRRARPQLAVQLPQQDRQPRDFDRQRWFFRAAGVQRLVGFWPTPHHEVWHPTEAVRLVQLLNAAGIVGEKPAYHLPVDQTARESMRLKMAAAGLNTGQPYLVFCGGGKTTSQHWPLDDYATVLRELHRALGVQVIAIGSRAEVAAVRNQTLPDFPQLLLAEQALSLGELCELCRDALAYLGNDTGPMHVAAAVECPAIAIISARNFPGQFDPDVEPRLLFRHRTPCEGCHLDDCNIPDQPCLRSITPAMVIEQSLPFLKMLSVRRATV